MKQSQHPQPNDANETTEGAAPLAGDHTVNVNEYGFFSLLAYSTHRRIDELRDKDEETYWKQRLLLCCAVFPHLDQLRYALAWRHLMPRLRQRLRHGGGVRSPFSHRFVWLLFTFACTKNAATTYASLLRQSIPTEIRDLVRRDLGRTLPTHCLFCGTASVGQQALCRVLHAYCALDPEVGYCQGMSFVVSALLIHLSEEETFRVFVQLMQQPPLKMRRLFLPGFPLLRQCLAVLRQLILRLLPQLARHLSGEEVDECSYAAQWFMTLWAIFLPLPLLSRLWDIAFAEGWRPLFQCAILVLQLKMETLLTLPMDHVVLHLKMTDNLGKQDEFLLKALDVPISAEDLILLRE